MIKTIVHLADIHIRKVPTRNDEYSKVFKNLVSSVKKQKPDRILIVGDLFHDYLDLQSEQLILASELLNDLAEIAPVRITRGNHDFRKKNTKRVDSVAAIVKILNNPSIVYNDKTGLFDDENVTWAVWHHGAPKNNPWKTKAGKTALTERKTNKRTYIDLFHDPINGCKSTTGFEMKSRSYYNIKDFQGDYTFLGDIHKMQYFGEKKAYCGSLIAQDVSEGDDAFHGYLLWDIVKGTTSEIEVQNEHSFKNIRINPFTDFEDLDFEIENPTKYMKVRIVWGTLPNTRNKENERTIVEYIKSNYDNVVISHKNEFVEEDEIDVDENITLEDITQESVQHEIFKDYFKKIGVEDDVVEDILNLDSEITKKIDVTEASNVEWSVVKFFGKNFMSYKDIEIDWRDKDGLYQITGINTAGKTTILKLISYILFSKTLETETRVKYGDKRFVNNKVSDDYCEASLVLEANGEYYGIKKRTDIERKKGGEIKGAPTKVFYHVLSTPDDEMTDDNALDALTEDNKVKTQKKIEEIIGDYDNFMRVVMTTSDTLNRILSNDMSVFVDSLLYDSGLDVFDKKLNALKDHVKELNKKSRITCNVESTKLANQTYQGDIGGLNNQIIKIEEVDLPAIQERINKGDEYVEQLNKKIFKIDPEIENLDVEQSKESVSNHKKEIERLNQRKDVLDEAIKPLKETYNEERLNELLEKKEEHKQQVHDLKLEIKDFERKISEEDHKIEILNGYIHVAKEQGGKNKEEILNLRKSKTCPTCGQKLTAEHQIHIDEKIKEVEEVMFSFVDAINKHQKVIDETHKPKIEEYREMISKNEKTVTELSTKMEDDLAEIGELTNDKNDVEKRKELQTELDQIPTKIQNEELRVEIITKKLDDYDKSQEQIEENKKIEKGITAAKEKIETLKGEENELRESAVLLKTQIKEKENKIKENEQLLKDFEEQEYQDSILELYKKCVHRDGIPRQLLSNYIIPRINLEMGKILSNIPFKVWLDADDLRPKLAYNNTPTAVVDAISASGKERTFASVVLKFALNQINVKSKPTLFLLDEVMGKLSEESVEEFVEILHEIKDRMKKFLIIEHNHEVHPDYLINVERSPEGISTAEIQ